MIKEKRFNVEEHSTLDGRIIDVFPISHRYIHDLEQQCKKQKEVIDKAIETLEKGITFCENDSQGIYDKCNIAINREKKVLDILKEVSE